MNGVVAAQVTSMLTGCLKIVTTRGSPEDLPYSRVLLHLSFVAAVLAGVLNRIVIPEVTVVHAMLNTAGEFGILLAGLGLVLNAKRMEDRFLKTATALLCISAMGGAALFVARWFTTPIAQILVSCIFLAQLSGAVTSLRRGLNVHWVVAGFYLFAYLWLAMLFFAFTSSLVESGTAAGASTAGGGPIA